MNFNIDLECLGIIQTQYLKMSHNMQTSRLEKWVLGVYWCEKMSVYINIQYEYCCYG